MPSGSAQALGVVARDTPNPGSREVSHNLLGQKLGRKGLETRERILKAALRQLEGAPDCPVTLTGVAREAAVGMSTLYLYFPDLGSLVLAALKRVMDSADAAFVDRLRVRWPDEGMEDACLDFLRAHYRFWREHARILHMRNSFADASDVRFLDYRASVSRPLIDLLLMQMDRPAEVGCMDDWAHLAAVLLTSFERLATLATAPNYPFSVMGQAAAADAPDVDGLLQAEATLVTLGVRHGRAGSARSRRAAAHAEPTRALD